MTLLVQEQGANVMASRAGNGATTFSRDALYTALQIMKRLVLSRTNIPVLSCVKVEIRHDRILWTATDLDTELVCVVPSTGSNGDWSRTVPAKLLMDIARVLPKDAELSMEPNSDTGAVIKADASRFTIDSIAVADFPAFSDVQYSHRFEVEPAVLAKAIQRSSFAISTEETRYYLNGIYLHGAMVADKPVLRAVATDGYRLAAFDMERPAGATEDMPNVIIPRRAVSILGMIAAKTNAPTMAVEIGKAGVRVTAGDIILRSKVVDGTFPDYLRVIPATFGRSATVERDELAAALRRVSIMAQKSMPAVRFVFDRQEVRLSSRDLDRGEAQDLALLDDYSGEPLEIGFRGSYVADALKAMPAGPIMLHLNDAGDPVSMRSLGDNDFQAILMPMRI